MKIAFSELTGVQMKQLGFNRPFQVGIAGLESMPKIVDADWRIDLLPYGEPISRTMFDTISRRPVAKFLVPRSFASHALARDISSLLDDMTRLGRGTSVRIDLIDHRLEDLFDSKVQDGVRSIIAGIQGFAGTPFIGARVERISEVLVAMGPETLETFERAGGFDAIPRQVAMSLPITSILT